MLDDIRKRKLSFGLNWVKSPSSGNTYLCPADFDASSASDEELKSLCVEESLNPQND